MPITSSSISSSDRQGEAAPSGPWRPFLRDLAAAAVLVLAAVLGTLVAVDPYDTGRFALLRTPGLPAQGPRTADASRGRDRAFDGAVIGNSHIQLISPAELAAATGIPFVSLAVPGTGPREQLALLDYFLRARARPVRALVLGIDEFWCTPDPALPALGPFPFWLYGRSPWRYLAGLVRYQAFDEAFRRVQYAAGSSRQPRARPDGYWDYDEGTAWRPEREGALLAGRIEAARSDATGLFPAMAALRTALLALPAEIPVVLVRPPVAATAIPAAATEAGRQDAACRDALAQAVAARPGIAMLDWRLDRPETRRAENFMDHTHYRSGLARRVEADIAGTLRDLSTHPPQARQ